jgi:hypothetical protein
MHTLDYMWCAQVNKQSVPACRKLITNRAFHAMLRRHGAIKEATALQVLADTFDAFDRSHKSHTWRDYAFSRCRRLLYNILGSSWSHARALSKAAGSTGRVRGLQVRECVRARVCI